MSKVDGDDIGARGDVVVCAVRRRRTVERRERGRAGGGGREWNEGSREADGTGGGEERNGMGARRQWPESGRRPRLGWSSSKKRSTVAVSRRAAMQRPIDPKLSSSLRRDEEEEIEKKSSPDLAHL